MTWSESFRRVPAASTIAGNEASDDCVPRAIDCAGPIALANRDPDMPKKHGQRVEREGEDDAEH